MTGLRPTNETSAIQRLREAFDEVSEIQHRRMIEKGFWTEGQERNFGETIALIHSELSEALEGHRHGNPMDEHCPLFTSVEIELADAVIRILDLAGSKPNLFRIGAAIAAKMEYNLSRPRKHGKTC